MKKEVSKGKIKTKKVVKKEPTKAEIRKKLQDPNVSTKEKNRLAELLYKDFPVY
jgi:hypothetical protein